MQDDLLKPSRDEALRKLGRNIVLFQQLESQFKQLIAHSLLEGSSPEDFKARLTARQQAVRTQTLGTLVGRYAKEVLHALHEDDIESDAAPDDPPPLIRTRFRIGEADLQQKLEALSGLVDERNRLVHCLLEDFDLQDANEIARLDAHLDEQANKVRGQIHEFNDIAMTWHHSQQEMVRFYTSEEGQRLIDLMLLRSSKVVRLLAEICQSLARGDGWSVLPLVALRLNESAPEQLANIKANHGHSSLKSLLLATQLFELGREATAKGMRDLVRLAPEG